MVRNINTAPETFSTVKDFFAEETIDETESDCDENTESFHSVETDPNQTCYSLRTKSTMSRGKNIYPNKENTRPSGLALDNDLSNSNLIMGKQNTRKSHIVLQQNSSKAKKSDDSATINKSLNLKKQNRKSKANVSNPKEMLKQIEQTNQGKNLSSIMENTDIPHYHCTESDETLQGADKANGPVMQNTAAKDYTEIAEPDYDPKKSSKSASKSVQGNKPGRKQKNPKRKEKPFVVDIIKEQNRTDLLVPKLPFSRLIKEILRSYEYDASYLRISFEALMALQESAEMFLTQLFQDSYLCTIHRGRLTLLVKDMKLAQSLRKL